MSRSSIDPNRRASLDPSGISRVPPPVGRNTLPSGFHDITWEGKTLEELHASLSPNAQKILDDARETWQEALEEAAEKDREAVEKNEGSTQNAKYVRSVASRHLGRLGGFLYEREQYLSKMIANNIDPISGLTVPEVDPRSIAMFEKTTHNEFNQMLNNMLYSNNPDEVVAHMKKHDRRAYREIFYPSDGSTGPLLHRNDLSGMETMGDSKRGGGIVHSLTKNFYDSKKGGIQWGGIAGALGGFLAGRAFLPAVMGEGILGGIVLPGLMAVGGAFGGRLLQQYIMGDDDDKGRKLFTPSPVIGMANARTPGQGQAIQIERDDTHASAMDAGLRGMTPPVTPASKPTDITSRPGIG